MYPQLLEPSILPTYKAAPRDPSSSSHSPRQLAAAAAAAMFGVVFPDHSFPLDATAFAQVAPNSWALDLSTLSLAAAPRSAVSFCGADGGKLVVPTDILDRWFRKFQERAKKDPSSLQTACRQKGLYS
uniref:Hikeshi-like domain-containing protein n=1 Tax=Oryza barthii TaxID=65489 RepID=A0A0D3FFY9_9ORYZ